MIRYPRSSRIALLLMVIIPVLLMGCASADSRENREANAALELGGLYFADGNIDKAIETYDRGLRIQPDDTRLLYNKIAALIKAERFSEAIELARTSYEQYPYLLRFAKAWAIGLELNGQQEEAIPVWQEIVELDPADSDSRLRLMNLLIDAERFEDARPHAMFLLERKTNDKASLEALVAIDQAAGGTGAPWSALLEAGFPTPVK